MFVKQLIGRQQGVILDMPFAEAKACIDAGTAARATDDEITAALEQSTAAFISVTPDQLLAGYRTEPAEEGGFHVFDAGGVRITDEPLHNQIAARDFTLDYSRRARGIPDLFGDEKPQGGAQETGGGNDGTGKKNPVDYGAMTIEQLREIALERKLDVSGISVKDDWVKLIEHDDKVNAHLAAGEFEKLTVADLRAVAEKQQIDLDGATAKPDVVAKVKAGYKAPVAA